MSSPAELAIWLTSNNVDRLLLFLLLPTSFVLARRGQQSPLSNRRDAGRAGELMLTSAGLLACLAIWIFWAGLLSARDLPDASWSGPLDRLISATCIASLGWLGVVGRGAGRSLRRWRTMLGMGFGVMLLAYAGWAPRWARAFDASGLVTSDTTTVAEFPRYWDASQVALASFVGLLLLLVRGRLPRWQALAVGSLALGSALDLLQSFETPLRALSLDESLGGASLAVQHAPVWSRLGLLATGIVLVAASASLARPEGFSLPGRGLVWHERGRALVAGLSRRLSGSGGMRGTLAPLLAPLRDIATRSRSSRSRASRPHSTPSHSTPSHFTPSHSSPSHSTPSHSTRSRSSRIDGEAQADAPDALHTIIDKLDDQTTAIHDLRGLVSHLSGRVGHLEGRLGGRETGGREWASGGRASEDMPSGSLGSEAPGSAGRDTEGPGSAGRDTEAPGSAGREHIGPEATAGDGQVRDGAAASAAQPGPAPAVDPALGERLSRYETALGHLPVGIVMTDARGRIAYRNPRAAEMLYDHGLVPGAPLAQALGRGAGVDDALRRSLEGGDRSEPARLTIGSPPVRVDLFGLRPAPGAPIAGLMAVLAPAALRDETRAHRMLPELTESLRAPVSSILGYSHLLREGSPLAEDQIRRYLERIDANLARLKVTLDNVAELLGTEHAPPAISRIDVQRGIAEAVERAHHPLEEKRIRLRAIAEAAPRDFQGPAALLERILDNLLVHAIQRSPQGGDIELRAETISSAEGGSRSLEIGVQDRGRMLGDMSRGPLDLSADNVEFPIELRIVQLLAEQQGGRAWVESHVAGVGAKVRLPEQG